MIWKHVKYQKIIYNNQMFKEDVVRTMIRIRAIYAKNKLRHGLNNEIVNLEYFINTNNNRQRCGQESILMSIVQMIQQNNIT